MMSLREQEYMTTVEKCGSISKAADLLHISQPSLSQYIQKIERRTGYQIFDRSNKILSLTVAGVEYMNTCHEILRLSKELIKKIDDISEIKRGRIVIGVTSHRSPYLLPEILFNFQRKYPGVNLDIIEKLSTDELEDITLRGEVDLFFTTTPLKNKGFSIEHLSDDILSLVIPPDSYISGNMQKMTFDEIGDFICCSLCNMKFVLSPQTMKLGRLIHKLFERINFEPQVFFETYNMDTGIAMASKGLCASFTFSTLKPQKDYGEVPLYIPIMDKDFTVSLVIAFPRQRYLSRAASAFIQMSREILGQRNLLNC
ncbi:LysR family transcriptional regulator [Cloacibacillus evryensis]|uniref:LysR family transcriptional regulator n=2 Tax=Cloacibacillus evryensis TaxID=508460 RepID=UPI0004AE9EB9|nr:LysR family transcriptional regulator [Cloacibacillus evryensis]MEA5036416.1 LysR family transcriptional regulator [Cloacibacillus evryensis]